MQFTQLAVQDDENMLREVSNSSWVLLFQTCFLMALQSSAVEANDLFHKIGKQFMGVTCSPPFLTLGLQSSAFDATDLFHKEVEPIHGSCFLCFFSRHCNLQLLM